MHFPSLRHLYCQNPFDLIPDFWTLLQEFTTTQDLRHLTTFGICVTPEDCDELGRQINSDEEDTSKHLHRFFTLSRLHGLQELRLAVDPSWDLEYVFTKLNIWSQIASGEQVLPQLRVLEVEFVDRCWGELFIPAVFTAFVEMLCSRRNHGRHFRRRGFARLKLECVRLLKSCSLDFAYSPEIEDQMKDLSKLIEEGLEVVSVLNI